jgi:hypothetical protein
VKSSGNPPNRAVRRTSGIGCAHFGQRGAGGAGLVTHSSDIQTFLTSANMSLFPDRSRHRNQCTSWFEGDEGSIFWFRCSEKPIAFAESHSRFAAHLERAYDKAAS